MAEAPNYQLPTTNYFRRGFTLIELMIFAVIFAITAIAFTTILLTALQIQTRQVGQSEVNQQSQFLLQQVEYYVSRASLVDMPQDTPTSTLKVRLGINSQDPTFITLASGTVYLEQTATGTLQALTSGKVTVSNLTFTRRENPPGHDAVNVAFTMTYNSQNIQQAFSEALQTTVARVSAATFDSDLRASSSNAYVIGAAAQEWKSINGTIFFNGSNVGIGVSPIVPFEVAGGNVRVDNGDVVVVTNGKGLILKDSGGSCWRFTVNTSGTITSGGSTVACP